MTIKAIETRYKGYRFRSRLEARWAVLFDALGVAWEYEKEGFELGEAGWYLPDFYLPGHNLWVEIKGTTPSDEDKAKLYALAEAGHEAVLLIGEIPAPGESHECSVFGADIRWPSHTTTVEGASGGALAGSMFAPHDADHLSRAGLAVTCPVCLFTYVRFGKPEMIESDNYGAWNGGRGSAIRIPGTCENGHSWVLRIGFHKGLSFAAVETVTEWDEDFTWFLAGWDPQKRDDARSAARSARFEHGESP